MVLHGCSFSEHAFHSLVRAADGTVTCCARYALRLWQKACWHDSERKEEKIMKKHIRNIPAAIVVLLCSAILANPAWAEEAKVASSSEMAPANEISDEGLVPVYPSSVAEGSYEIEAECSSSMFPIDKCTVTVEDGEFTVTLTMGGDGYLYVYPGTGEEAASVSEEEWIPFVLDEDGKQTYTFSVEALDQLTDLAAFSKRKEKWYDRVLLLHASGLPAEARTDIETVTAESAGLEDGTYLVELTLGGGKGYTAVKSPAVLEVENQEAWAEIVWGSDKYDYMIVGGEKILPTDTGRRISLSHSRGWL